MPPAYLHHQPVAAQQFYECVPARETSRVLKLPFQHQPQFHAAKPRVVIAVFLDPIHNHRLERQLAETLVIDALVICLPAVTKQSAQRTEPEARLRLAEQTHCLVPAFFLMGMLKFASATSIIVS